MSENNTQFRVYDVPTELALLRQSLDTVIEQHGKGIEENKTTSASAHSRLSVVELQVNTHEVKVAELVLKSRSAFGNFWIILSGSTAAVALLIGLVK